MGVDRRFNLDVQNEVDEAEKFFKTTSENLDIIISICEKGDKKPFVELSGSISSEEIVSVLGQRRQTIHAMGQKDELTGLFSREYFFKRMSTIDRSQVLPVAIINFNVNDWRFVNEKFGDEASDRLIKIIADIIEGESKPYFICGRMEGDVFGVIIPMALDNEAEEFVADVKERCKNYSDDILAPSVGAGIVYKTNIEQNLEDLMSDAEYLMFEDKFATKNEAGYRDRLEHGLQED